MNTPVSQQTRHTEGTATADIFNPQNTPDHYSFEAEPARLLMYRNNNSINVIVGQKVSHGSLTDHSIFLTFPDMVQGESRSFDFSDATQMTAYYNQTKGFSTTPYSIVSGEGTLSLDHQDVMTVTFKGRGAWNNDRVEIDRGAMRLEGFQEGQALDKVISHNALAVGTLSVAFTGGPSGESDFNATTVHMIYEPGFPVGEESYWLMQGYGVQNLRERVFYIVIKESATGSQFDLATSKDVALGYYFYGDGAAGVPVSGTLTVEHHPASGRAKGSFDCVLRGNHSGDYRAVGTFDIK
ncbi:hypothetical protein LVW35_11550 [Pseudomonas sp. HN11]|uniref:hypothetical protein n=1 Tax=Pseudomonas sp. HN11 TaxID=1344094 RepID=UPI001F3DE523|nr:hypothetical protein [Pseudomonas sp. HN11]UII73766.1 hypothetical protein LVW35_11550 [Pseudomonas sp. HN11]